MPDPNPHNPHNDPNLADELHAAMHTENPTEGVHGVFDELMQGIGLTPAPLDTLPPHLRDWLEREAAAFEDANPVDHVLHTEDSVMHVRASLMQVSPELQAALDAHFGTHTDPNEQEERANELREQMRQRFAEAFGDNVADPLNHPLRNMPNRPITTPQESPLTNMYKLQRDILLEAVGNVLDYVHVAEVHDPDAEPDDEPGSLVVVPIAMPTQEDYDLPASFAFAEALGNLAALYNALSPSTE